MSPKFRRISPSVQAGLNQVIASMTLLQQQIQGRAALPPKMKPNYEIITMENIAVRARAVKSH